MTDTVHLWVNPLSLQRDTGEHKLTHYLSPSERQRYDAIRHPKRRQAFLQGRCLLRHALSELFHKPQDYWQISEKPSAAPVLINPVRHCCFSISHSHDLLVVSVSAAVHGVDIEYKKPRENLDALYSAVCSVEELAAIAELGGKNIDQFYRVWCAKEALYKALPAKVQTTTALSDLSYQMLHSAQEQWTLFEFTPDNYQLTVAAQSTVIHVRLHG